MKRPPLQTAGAVSDVIGKKSVTLQIEFHDAFRVLVRRVEKRQTGVGELAQARFEIARQIGATADFAVLPRGLKARAVGEAAAWKSGVGQLPNQPVIGDFRRGFQNKL